MIATDDPWNPGATTLKAWAAAEPDLHDMTPLPQRSLDTRRLAISLLKDCWEDESAHLELRCIRDDQAQRFEALKTSHPDIYSDFMAARKGPHEVLLRNRRRRVEILTAIVEGNQQRLSELGAF